jgi:hypothetical protein
LLRPLADRAIPTTARAHRFHNSADGTRSPRLNRELAFSHATSMVSSMIVSSVVVPADAREQVIVVARGVRHRIRVLERDALQLSRSRSAAGSTPSREIRP